MIKRRKMRLNGERSLLAENRVYELNTGMSGLKIGNKKKLKKKYKTARGF